MMEIGKQHNGRLFGSWLIAGLTFACAGVVSVALLCSGWVAFPLSAPISGVRYPVMTVISGTSFPALSYGVISSILILLGVGAAGRGNWNAGFWAGLSLLLLVVCAPLQLSIYEPWLLFRLAEESEWMNMADEFARQFLPANLGIEPTTWSSLPLETVLQRVLAGWYFMGVGWYLAAAAALSLLAPSLLWIRPGARVRYTLVAVSLLLGMAGVLLIRPALAELALVKAAQAEAGGDGERAVTEYNNAQRLDGWNLLRISVRQHLGRLDANRGETRSFNYRVYAAERMVRRGRSQDAVAEYESAGLSGEEAFIADERRSELLTNVGLQLYETGSFGGAVDAWRKALAFSPSNYLAGFCLTRGYFAVGKNSEAARVASLFLDARDPEFRANLYSNLGDARTAGSDFGGAHIAYNNSYHWDYVFNRRG